ncbi:MAG: extracellular solute-binding protein [Anaerolineaceae bacterium]|nr:MAG: extracellular solute-binding protein [Anaerolineaceae bacterium]
MKKWNLLRTIIIVVLLTATAWFLALIIIVKLEVEKIDAANTAMNRSYMLSDEEVSRGLIKVDIEAEAYSVMLNNMKVVSGDGVSVNSDGVYVPVDARCNIKLTIQEAGDYFILVEYNSEDQNFFENMVNINVNDEEFVASFPFLWADDILDKRTDRYGNEITPKQYRIEDTSRTYLEDYEHFFRTPICFPLNQGDNFISITPQNQSMTVSNIKLIPATEDNTYNQYISEYKSERQYEGIITIEGEDYRAKSDSYIRGTNVQNTSMSPQNPYVKLINAIDDKSNKTIGQKVIYEVDVPMTGIYYLTFKYSQPLKSGGDSYRTIEVDGKVPFKESRDVGFTHTGMSKYENYTLGGESPMGIYLTEGIHTITLKVTAGPMDRIYRELIALTDEINEAGLVMKKIKGSNSDDTAKIDTNRTWDILQYMPTILDDLEDWQSRLHLLYKEIKELGGKEPSFVSDLILAAQNLDRLASEPREIPNRMALLCDDSGSASQLIALTLTKIYEQNLSIDCFYLHGADVNLPSPQAGIWAGFLTAAKQFIYSFSDIMNEEADVTDSEGALTVWINKPVQYVEVLREITAQEFTTKEGIDVVFSVMPDEKKITLANSTKSNPDMALGLSYYRPAEFAMRGMAKNLLEYDDFLDWYCDEYNIESLTPMAYEDGIYGASETQDFYVLFYRSDILEMLGLPIPNTWDDVKKIMPILHRNAMNFNLTLANNVGYKPFEATSFFIFQNGGNFYSEDGFSSNFNDPATLKGIREMIDLYQVYGLAQNIPNFFNAFRSGSVPIGISNFATYLQLQVGAPELTGRWDITMIPGTVGEDGTISRYYSADMTSAMIFANTNKSNQAYQFLKWWLSSETQKTYAITLQMKYGPDYIWNTANHIALDQMSYPRKHREVILNQWSWQKEVLRHPASYILERELSNSWIEIVTKGESFRPRMDEAMLASNREMKRKLTEFGYYDDKGIPLKAYNMNLIEDLKDKQRIGEKHEE